MKSDNEYLQAVRNKYRNHPYPAALNSTARDVLRLLDHIDYLDKLVAAEREGRLKANLSLEKSCGVFGGFR